MSDTVPIGILVPWGKNPRKNDDAVKAVAESIKRFGFGNPILVRRESNQIIAGHTRLKAAKLLGMQEVPVRYMDLNEREAQLLALADNRLGEIADWDFSILPEMLSDYGLEEAALAGFDESFLSHVAKEWKDLTNANDSNLEEQKTCEACGQILK